MKLTTDKNDYRATDEVRVDHQSEECKTDRPKDTGDDARREGDQMKVISGQLAVGSKETGSAINA